MPLAFALFAVFISVAFAQKVRTYDEIVADREAQQKGTITDSRDGKKYKIVKIGVQWWMAENLNYPSAEAKCYDNNSENCKKYGRLYDLYTADDACPEDWRLPSDDDWEILIDFAGGSETAGKKLKAASGWDDYEDGTSNGTDDFGFMALPGGYSDGGYFYDVGKVGNWWSKSHYYSYSRGISYNNEDVSRDNSKSKIFFSVRCIYGDP
jgi:uncharacterized protein (TIGR02145 family)